MIVHNKTLINVFFLFRQSTFIYKSFLTINRRHETLVVKHSLVELHMCLIFILAKHKFRLNLLEILPSKMLLLLLITSVLLTVTAQRKLNLMFTLKDLLYFITVYSLKYKIKAYDFFFICRQSVNLLQIYILSLVIIYDM